MRIAFVQRDGHGFVGDYVLARFHGANSMFGMDIVGGSQYDQIHVRIGNDGLEAVVGFAAALFGISARFSGLLDEIPCSVSVGVMLMR